MKALYNHCRRNQGSQVSSILLEQEDIDLLYKDGIYLRFAIQNNNSDMLDSLLKYYFTRHDIDDKLEHYKIQKIIYDYASTSDVSVNIEKILIKYNFLIKDESDIDELDLINASSSGDVKEVVRLLKSSKIDINLQEDLFGNTALHFASQNGHDEVISLLKESGADENIKNKKGLFPEQVYNIQHITEEKCFDTLLNLAFFNSENSKYVGNEKVQLWLTNNVLSNQQDVLLKHEVDTSGNSIDQGLNDF